MTKVLPKVSASEAIQNAAQTLLANIRLTNLDDPAKTVAITSAVAGEGKSTIAIQLARAIALGGHTALLMDCDLRTGKLAEAFGVPAATGLVDVLAGTTGLEDAVAGVADGIFLLTGGTAPNPPELLVSAGFRELLAQAAQKYDFVILDTPAVSDYVDAVVVAAFVDATVLVVREGYGDRIALVDAHEQLVAAGAKMAGVAMNYFSGERSLSLRVADEGE